MRSATKGFKGSKTYSSTEEDTTCLGSSSRRLIKNPGARSIYALNHHAFTMTPLELSETSPASKNTTQENTARRNGSATSAPRGTPFNRIGRLILRHAELGNTDATVALSSQGGTVLSLIGLSVMHWLRRVQGILQA